MFKGKVRVDVKTILKLPGIARDLNDFLKSFKIYAISFSLDNLLRLGASSNQYIFTINMT